MNLKDFLNPPEDENRVFKSPKYWADLLQHLEQDDSKVKDILMALKDFAYIRKFGRDVFDTCTEGALLKRGFCGRLYNVGIWITRGLPQDHIKVTSEANSVKEESSFCCIMNQKVSGPCTNPECIVRHIHLC